MYPFPGFHIAAVRGLGPAHVSRTSSQYRRSRNGNIVTPALCSRMRIYVTSMSHACLLRFK